MKHLAICAASALCQLCFVASASAQASATPTPKFPEASQLEILARKIDEQNAKIDTLSQQILKLQQEIAEKRPGVIIGENAPATTPTASAADAAHAAAAAGGTSHTVARGETLTSIAKMYHVSIDDLQRANHIENPLKLLAGQTIMIPTAGAPTPTPTPSASPGG